jgi:hypothetical protein
MGRSSWGFFRVGLWVHSPNVEMIVRASSASKGHSSIEYIGEFPEDVVRSEVARVMFTKYVIGEYLN